VSKNSKLQKSVLQFPSTITDFALISRHLVCKEFGRVTVYRVFISKQEIILPKCPKNYGIKGNLLVGKVEGRAMSLSDVDLGFKSHSRHSWKVRMTNLWIVVCEGFTSHF
jgi:hypothetical protein